MANLKLVILQSPPFSGVQDVARLNLPPPWSCVKRAR